MKEDDVLQKNITTHLKKLTEEIGVRLAGSSSGEQQAVGYIAEKFRGIGASVMIEEFPIQRQCVELETLEICISDKWRSFPCSLSGNTPDRSEEIIEASLCFFEAKAEYQRKDLSFLKGKAVVHLGSLTKSMNNYKRLIEAEPELLLFIDERFPGTVPLPSGILPAFRPLGTVRAVSVAYMDAWQWKADGASAVRFLTKGGMQEGTSQNVIADIAGTDPEKGLLILGAHHDTQPDSEIPFPTQIPKALDSRAGELWRDLYGGWNGPKA